MSKNKKSSSLRAACIGIEMLEQRRLLSTVSFTTLSDGTKQLFVKGTDGKDNIYIFHDPVGGSVTVVDDKNGNGAANPGETSTFLLDPNELSVIRVDAKKGNDRVEIRGDSTYSAIDLSMQIDLGPGDDNALFTTDSNRDLTFGPAGVLQGADFLDHSDINLDIEGESGKDKIEVDLLRASIIGSEVTVQVDAGTEDDTVILGLPLDLAEEVIGGFPDADNITQDTLPTDGGNEDLSAVVQVEIDLGSGNDTVNQTNITGIFNGSAVGIIVDGGSGKDIYNDAEGYILGDGSTLNVDANLGTGNDRYAGQYLFGSFDPTMTATATTHDAPPFFLLPITVDSDSSASIKVLGGDGDDKVEADDFDFNGPFLKASTRNVNGGTTTHGEDPITFGNIDGLQEIKLYGGRGKDLVEIDLNPSALVPVTETGIFRGLVSGDDDNDRLRIDILATGTGGQFDLSMLGGAGNDSLGAAFQDDSEFGVNYGPRGAILVDGGRNTDKYDTEGNGVFSIRSAETEDDTLEDPFI